MVDTMPSHQEGLPPLCEPAAKHLPQGHRPSAGPLRRTSGRLKTKLAIVSASFLLLLAACATPLAEEARVHLGGSSFIELRLPPGWELRPVFGSTPTVERVRVFAGGTEVMQVIPVRWNKDRALTDPNHSQLHGQAASTLGERGLCHGVSLKERKLPQGLAVYCETGQGGGQQVAGVLANPRMVAAFSFSSHPGESAAILWRVLGTVRHFSFEMRPNPSFEASPNPKLQGLPPLSSKFRP